MGLTDGQWAVLEPLIEAWRPAAKVPPQHLRRTVSAIIWRHDNGAKLRALPEEPGPWWMTAQTFIRWSRLSVWKRLLGHRAQRGPCRLPGLDLQQSQPRRASLGQDQGVACRGYPIREDRLLLPRCPSTRRRTRLAQTLTDPNYAADVAFISMPPLSV